MRAPATRLPLRAQGLGFTAGGVAILADITVTLEPGAPSVILGPNGAGKSVLLRLLHGLLRPTAGRVMTAGGNGPLGAMVFQRPVLLRRDVLANVAYPLGLAGIPRADRTARARAALEGAGLGHLADRPARLLSGGEQQRVALARAAALGPEILFLDEPTASLDPTATRAVEASIAGLAARGTKIVMATHDLGQARRLAAEILFLHRGALREHAPAAAFFAGPATPEARAFLAGDLAC